MGNTCLPNIGPRQRRHRLIVGVFAALAGVLALTLLLATESPRMARLLAVLPFWAGALGLLQYHERTCVALASRGLCDLGAGLERLSPDETTSVRTQARRVHRRALWATVAYAVVALALP